MTIEEQNLQTTRELYTLSAMADWLAVRRLLCEDFFVTEAPGLPFEGVYSGRDGLQQLFEKVMGMMSVTGLDLLQLTAGGDWVIAIVEMKVRVADEDLCIPLTEAIRFREGKVAEIKPYYFDPALVHRAVSAGPG